MLEVRAELYLSQEALVRDGVRYLASENLDRYSAPITCVFAQIDRRHTAAAELALDPIELADLFWSRRVRRGTIAKVAR
jgi:hypothetical protein